MQPAILYMATGLGGLTSCNLAICFLIHEYFFEQSVCTCIPKWKCKTWQLDWVGSPLATWPYVAHLVGLPNASEKRGGCNNVLMKNYSNSNYRENRKNAPHFHVLVFHCEDGKIIYFIYNWIVFTVVLQFKGWLWNLKQFPFWEMMIPNKKSLMLVLFDWELMFWVQIQATQGTNVLKGNLSLAYNTVPLATWEMCVFCWLNWFQRNVAQWC